MSETQLSGSKMEVHVRLKNAFPGWIHGGIGYFSNERRFSVESSLQRISSNLWLWNRNDLSVELYCFGTSIGGSGRTNTLFPSDHELLNEKRKDRAENMIFSARVPFCQPVETTKRSLWRARQGDAFHQTTFTQPCKKICFLVAKRKWPLSVTHSLLSPSSPHS